MHPEPTYAATQERKGGDSLSERKYAFAALAVASVLLGSLFVGRVILAQGGGAYDPWLDYNEDGIIDGFDLTPMAGAYGSLGDSTKNVNVTNWPQPQKPTFPEILVLRGLRYSLYNQWRTTPPTWYSYEDPNILVTEDMPIPPLELIGNYSWLLSGGHVSTEWTLGEIVNFTFVPASATFVIQGDVIIRPTIYYMFEATGPGEVVHWNITLYLEKINYNSGTTVLASHTFCMSDDGSSDDLLTNIGVTFNFPTPAIVESGEKLQIRFETWVRCDLGYYDSGEILVFHTLGTDEFIAYIPIYQP